jgi:hypothetical protein
VSVSGRLALWLPHQAEKVPSFFCGDGTTMWFKDRTLYSCSLSSPLFTFSSLSLHLHISFRTLSSSALTLPFIFNNLSICSLLSPLSQSLLSRPSLIVRSHVEP